MTVSALPPFRAIVLAMVAILALGACSEAPTSSVELRVVSDLVPYFEVGTATVTLYDGAATNQGLSRSAYERAVAVGEPLTRGVWLVRFADIPHGTYTVWVTLQRDNGERLGRQPRTFTLRQDTSITVTIEAACGGVECPNGGNAAFLACVAGRCVDPRCSAEEPEHCPVDGDLFCESDAQCDSVLPCGSARCESGICLQIPTANECGSGEFCSPISGCTPEVRPEGAPEDPPGSCGDACALATSPCTYAYIACSTEATGCVAVADRPAGSPCPNQGLCDGVGQCVAGARSDAGTPADMGTPPDMNVPVDMTVPPDMAALPDMAGPPSCDDGYEAVGPACVDIDECATGNGGCGTTPFVTCVNVPGSRECVVPRGPFRLTEGAEGLSPVGNGASTDTSTSADGTIVAFVSSSENLVRRDTNFVTDVFVRDRAAGVTRRVSTSGDDEEADGPSSEAVLTADGTKVVFTSEASNLVADDTNGVADIFLKDLVTGEVVRVSTDSLGEQLAQASGAPSVSADGTRIAFVTEVGGGPILIGGSGIRGIVSVKDLSSGALEVASSSAIAEAGNQPSYDPAISPDGTMVVFASDATNLVADDTNGVADVFVKTLGTGDIARVSVDALGAEADAESVSPVFASDGAVVVFSSSATNFVAGDSNAVSDIFVKVLLTGEIERVSVTSTGAEANGDSLLPVASADGSRVAFESDATNLVLADGNMQRDLFVKNLLTGAVNRAATSGAEGGVVGPGASRRGSPFAASLSEDGALVAFVSSAGEFVAGDDNSAQDAFVHDVEAGGYDLVSRSRSGPEANDDSSLPRLAADGSRVVFTSYASNLSYRDTNAFSDVFGRDLATGFVEFVAPNARIIGPGRAPGDAYDIVPSADGVTAAFVTESSLLATSDANGLPDVYFVLRFQWSPSPSFASTLRASIGAGGLDANGASWGPSMASGLMRVAFVSSASNLVAGDTNGFDDIFVATYDERDVISARASTSAGGAQANGASWGPSISESGTQVAFVSSASNLVAIDTNGAADIFVKDLTTDAVVRVSVGFGGAEANGASSSAVLSGDGTRIAFVSSASNLVGGDTNGADDVFVAELLTGVITRVSMGLGSVQANGDSSSPTLSRDGRRVAFVSSASNLVASDTNGVADVFVRDLDADVTRRLSVSADGVEGDGPSNSPSISGDGRRLVFVSLASNLVAVDANGVADVFLAGLD